MPGSDLIEYFEKCFMCVSPFFIVTSELVILSLDLVKTRLSVMSLEMRKNFIQVILTSLIEKSTDAKILRAVVKIVEEWVKNTSPMGNQVNCLFGSDLICCISMPGPSQGWKNATQTKNLFLD